MWQAPVFPREPEQGHGDDGRKAGANWSEKRSSGSDPCDGSRRFAARNAPLPGMGARATTLPSPETACEMPELARRKIGMPYSAARTGATRAVQFVLVATPKLQIHRRDDEQLRALPHQFIRDAGVTQVVADAETNLAPRRIPDFLRRRGQAVPKELNRDALAC